LTTTSHGSTTNNSSNVTRITDVRDLRGSRDDPFGGYLDEDKFNEIAKYGCSWCTADVEYKEPGVIVYEREETILCPSCANNNDHNRVYVVPEKLAR